MKSKIGFVIVVLRPYRSSIQVRFLEFCGQAKSVPLVLRRQDRAWDHIEGPKTITITFYDNVKHTVVMTAAGQRQVPVWKTAFAVGLHKMSGEK